MQANRLTIILTAGIVILAASLPSRPECADETASLKFYESCIVRKIAACGAKAFLLNSRSRNLREYARLNIQKAAFWAEQKESLIYEMLEKQIALKDHSIQIFINTRFNDEILVKK